MPSSTHLPVCFAVCSPSIQHQIELLRHDADDRACAIHLDPGSHHRGIGPKRVVQIEWLRIATGAAFGRSSSGVNARPSAGTTPSVSKNDGDTGRCSARSPTCRRRRLVLLQKTTTRVNVRTEPGWRLIYRQVIINARTIPDPAAHIGGRKAATHYQFQAAIGLRRLQ